VWRRPSPASCTRLAQGADHAAGSGCDGAPAGHIRPAEGWRRSWGLSTCRTREPSCASAEASLCLAPSHGLMLAFLDHWLGQRLCPRRSRERCSDHHECERHHRNSRQTRRNGPGHRPTQSSVAPGGCAARRWRPGRLRRRGAGRSRSVAHDRTATKRRSSLVRSPVLHAANITLRKRRCSAELADARGWPDR
jgi:hypothetical protein